MCEYLAQLDVTLDRLTRAGGGCIRFNEQPMPAGATPAHATVTIDVRSCVTLQVSPTVRCELANREVRLWFEAGECRFPNAAMASQWAAVHLGPLYVTQRQTTPTTAASRSNVASRTDLTEVMRLRGGNESMPISVDPVELADRLGREVFGQEHVLQPLAADICRHLSRVNPRRPYSAWFAGPTGVGKTRTAELLAGAIEALVGDRGEYAYTRLDMSEYGEGHRRSQLLGAPQGYVGHGDGAQLVDDLANNARRVVHFDEIEKAHPTILQTLMNAMDAGRLSSPSRTANGSRDLDCREAIFVFTSNLCSDGIISELTCADGFGDAARADEVCRKQVRLSGVASELVARVTRFLVFKPLSAEAEAAVAAHAVHAIGCEYGVDVAYVEPELVAHILDRTKSRGFGARPYEYAADEIVGPALVAARKLARRVRLCAGPPVCAIADSNAAQHAATPAEGDRDE